GSGDRGHAIGHGLARTGTGLNRHHRRVTDTPTLFVDFNRAKHLGNFGNHQALAITRLKRLGFEKTGISALDLGLEFSTEHGGLGTKSLDKFSVFVIGGYHSALINPALNRLTDW